MKKNLMLLLFWFLVISGCKWSMNVVEYNDSFVSVVKECTDANKALFDTFEANEATIDSIVESLHGNIDICSVAKEKALQLWDFQKDSSLKDAVVDVLTAEVDYLEKFWSTEPYWNMQNKTDEDKMAYEWIVNDLTEAQNQLNQQFINLQSVQEAFAAKYNLDLK